MATLTNINSNARSMNGISVLSADEIYSENLVVSGLTLTNGLTATASQTINFGINAPTMSGANITNIPSSALPSTIAYKNTSNTFTNNNTFTSTTSFAGTPDAIVVPKTSTSGYIFLNNNGGIGYWNGTSIIWAIDASGNGTFQTTSNIPLKNQSNIFSAINYFSSYLIPYFSATNSSSLRIGNGTAQYQDTTATDNIAIGNNAFQGYAGGSLNTSVRGIYIGNNCGQQVSNQYTGAGTSTTDNVMIGCNVYQNGIFPAYENVLIGSQVVQNQLTSTTRSVLIGANVCKNAYYDIINCVIIGANSLLNYASGNSQGATTCVGTNNLPSCSANAIICYGTNLGQNCVEANSCIFIGNNSASNNGSGGLGGTSNFYIGNNCGNSLDTGFNNILIGNFTDVNNSQRVNTQAFGHGISVVNDDECVIGSPAPDYTGTKYNISRLRLNTKTFLQCTQTTSSSGSVFNLSFNTPEYVLLTSNITTIVLPNPYNTYPTISTNFCIGARFKFIKTYSTAVSITIYTYNQYNSLTPVQYIVKKGVSTGSISFTSNQYALSIVCTDNQAQPSYSNNIWIIDEIVDILSDYAQLSVANTFTNTNTFNMATTFRDGATSSIRPVYQNPLWLYYPRVGYAINRRFYFRSGVNTGSDNIVFDVDTSVKYYMVGGGGGGAGNVSTNILGGGGGGSGQLLTGTFTALAGVLYTLTTNAFNGGGSSGNATSVSAGASGGSVSITGTGLSLVAAGGIGGSAHTSTAPAGRGGDSGSGALGGNGGATSGSIGSVGASQGGGAGGSFNNATSALGNSFSTTMTDGTIITIKGGDGGANNATSGANATTFGCGGSGGGGTSTQAGGNGVYGFILLEVFPYNQETYLFNPTYGITSQVNENSRLIATTEYVKNQYYLNNTFQNLVQVNVPSNVSPTTSTTGVNGAVQIVCTTGTTSVARDAIGIKAGTDTNSIINFANSAGTLRGSIAGGATPATSVAYNTSSDERLKENIVNMPSQLENIKSLCARSFDWKSTGEQDKGFIAQEIYRVYPELNPLRNNDNYEDKLYPIKSDGSNFIHMIDYGKMTPYLWSAVQELTLIIEKQQKQIDELISYIKSR
jgi:hypothetical protein